MQTALRALKRRKKSFAGGGALLLVLILSACQAPWTNSPFAQGINNALNGNTSTFTSYTAQGAPIDAIRANSMAISRDTKFDTNNSDGTSQNNSSVMEVSVGSNLMETVGASALIVQQGIQEIDVAKTGVKLTDTGVGGHPFLNYLYYHWRNIWGGRSETIIIRSQQGNFIAAFAGKSVKIESTDVPQSTWFLIDGKNMFAYRVDYDIIDTSLLTTYAG